MTDTERKEVEELTKALQESISKENSTWNSFEVVAKRLIAKGYTKRPQDNNALVPLDRRAFCDYHMPDCDGRQGGDNCSCGLWDVIAKFGKDNSGMDDTGEPKEPVHDCGCGMGESCHALKKERKVSLEEIDKAIKFREIDGNHSMGA